MEKPQPVSVILTGATGMVGEGVLHECLRNFRIGQVLVLGRKSCGIVHPKLKEIVHGDFFDLVPIEDQLQGYDACLFCAGVSSVGMKETQFHQLTYTLTLNVAKTLARLNRQMIFCYISGAGTDSSEKGRIMWARIKGKTENHLSNLGFSKNYNFRPGILTPTKGLKNTLAFYKYLGWTVPLVRFFSRISVSSLAELGKAMIHVATYGYQKTILEVSDIKSLAKNYPE